jgi:predicted TIM-barrel fold metal-dependent hydrolase
VRRNIEGIAELPKDTSRFVARDRSVQHGLRHRPEASSGRRDRRGARPCVDKTLELSGVDKSMFESNFPVERRGSSHTDLRHAFKMMMPQQSPRERARALPRQPRSAVYKIA